MKKFFLTLIIFVVNIFSMNVTHAETEEYVGSGEYIMSEFETLDIAKQRAKQKAERHAQEQAGVFVESYTKVTNQQIAEDEIFTMTSGILNIVDVQYKITPLEDGKSILITATILATIDSYDVDKWLEKSIAQRSQLVEQNEALRRANAEQKKQIAELKRKLEAVKNQKEDARVNQEISVEKIFSLPPKKIDTAEIIDRAYYNDIVIRYTKTVKVDPNCAWAYNYRGDAYLNLGNRHQALADFTKAIEIDPNFAAAYYNRGLCYQILNEEINAQADFDKAKELGHIF